MSAPPGPGAEHDLRADQRLLDQAGRRPPPQRQGRGARGRHRPTPRRTPDCAQPLVIRLQSYVRVPRGDRRRLSRRAVLARDGYRCQYCGSTRHLTLDHVIPSSRGGATSWENVVTSCAPCNTHKAARLPHEVGMELHAKPRPPSLADFLVSSPHGVPESWRRTCSRAPSPEQSRRARGPGGPHPRRRQCAQTGASQGSRRAVRYRSHGSRTIVRPRGCDVQREPNWCSSSTTKPTSASSSPTC